MSQVVLFIGGGVTYLPISRPSQQPAGTSTRSDEDLGRARAQESIRKSLRKSLRKSIASADGQAPEAKLQIS